MKLTFLKAFDQLVPADDSTWEYFRGLDPQEYITFDIPDNHITEKQVNSLNLWCRLVSETFMEAGLDMRKIIREEVEIPVTEHGIKEHIYKPLLKVMTGKESTMDQDRMEPSMVAEVIHRHYAQNYGITLPPWPKKKV